VWNGEQENFTRAPWPTEILLDPDAAYAHFTSNETIQGVQFQEHPDPGNVQLFCDMTSDFLSRPLDINCYSLVYAGAQKNAGIAGVTVVIIRDDILEQLEPDMHTLLDYRVHVAKNSIYNTPPVFAIYMVMLVTQWLRDEIGGLENMAAINERKSRMLYEVIDQSNGFYHGHAKQQSRSQMNVTWQLRDKPLEEIFSKEATNQKLVNLKGHRSMGGLRASIYNGMPLGGVQTLREFMLDFQVKYAV
jgi:phosphoserine aminotransferase